MTDEKAEWHWLQGKEQSGPHPLSKVLEAVAQGIVNRTSYVWRQGWPEWKPAGSVPELFTQAAVSADQAQTVTALHETTAAQRPKPTGNYFTRHWRGDLSLPISFWVNGVLLTIALALFQLFLVGWLNLIPKMPGIGRDASGVAGLLEITAVALPNVAVIALAIWQYVGIWRSASKHVGRGGRVIWAIAAKVIAVVGVFGAVALF